MDTALTTRRSTQALSTRSPAPPSNSTSGRAIAVILKPLIDLHGEPQNWATSAPLYMEALSDIPPEVLAKAVRHCIQTCRFFPKPAELRSAIADELFEVRRREYDRSRALPAPDAVEAPTAEDIAYVAKLVAPVLVGIRRRSRAFRELPPLPREPLPAFHLAEPDDPRVAAAMKGDLPKEEDAA